MEESTLSKILYWLPRICGIALAAFFIVFTFASHGVSVDSLVESSVWLALVIMTIIAWKWEGVGGLIFIAVGLIFIALTYSRATITGYLAVAIPVIITGILFIISKYRK